MDKKRSSKLGMVVHTCNPSTQEAEDGKFKATLGYIVRSCFRKTTTKIIKRNNRKTRKEKDALLCDFSICFIFLHTTVHKVNFTL
jgi:hypothetical protein